jgi:hypothetical protein
MKPGEPVHLEVPDWEVDGPSVRQEDTLGPGMSGLMETYVVPYKITSGPARGHTGSVRIPADEFTEDNVREAVSRATSAVHRIAQIGPHDA